MNFLDLFAGIGGFRLGMEQAGHTCVGFVEIDKFARASYKEIHNTEGEFEAYDITTISDETIRSIGRVDVITGGFPCQAFSIAGDRKGFEDTRGTLFFEIARFASILRPSYLFLENVYGLLNHDKGNTFETILRTLDELGYDVEWQVLNSKNYVPQSRERVYIIAHLRTASTRKIFPIGSSDKGINSNRIKTINSSKKLKSLNKYISRNRFYDIKGIGPTLTTTGSPLIAIPIKEATSKGFKDALPGDSISLAYVNSKTRRGRVGKQLASTLLTTNEQGIITEDYKIRRLTPRECWRLQSFPDWAFNKARKVNSDSQLYKQAGNSVTVKVIYAIAKRL